MGLYAPLIMGEMDGLKIGLDTDVNLWQLTNNFEYEKYEGEWLIGFGVGFNKGQYIRTQLRKNVFPEIFHKRISAVLLLYKKKQYSIFSSSILRYIENIEMWELKNIPNIIVEDLINLLKSKSLQQAIYKLVDFYEKNFILIGLLEFETISDRLRELRINKKNQLCTKEQYVAEKESIIIDLQHWIEKYATK